MKKVTAIRLPRGIRQRGNSFLVDVSVKGVGRQTATVHTLEEALTKQQELKQVSSKKKETISWTIQQAFDTVTSLVPSVGWRGSKSEKTSRINATTALNYFGPDKALDDITIDELDEYVAFLEEEGKSDATINRKIAALSKMMTVAMRGGGLSVKLPMPRRKEGAGRIRYLTSIEEKQLLQLLDQWGMRNVHDAVIVLADTGLRVGELLKLEVKDIQPETRMIHIWENKGDTPRSVPMTKRVWDIIKKRMIVGRLFPYRYHWLRSAWERARVVMEFADDPQFVPHALRHTTASRLVQRGVPLKVVQEWMGHKTIQVTMRYAHLAPINLMNARDMLEK